jgi:hypothetical protein
LRCATPFGQHTQHRSSPHGYLDTEFNRQGIRPVLVNGLANRSYDAPDGLGESRQSYDFGRGGNSLSQTSILSTSCALTSHNWRISPQAHPYYVPAGQHHLCDLRRDSSPSHSEILFLTKVLRNQLSVKVTFWQLAARL